MGRVWSEAFGRSERFLDGSGFIVLNLVFQGLRRSGRVAEERVRSYNANYKGISHLQFRLGPSPLHVVAKILPE